MGQMKIWPILLSFSLSLKMFAAIVEDKIIIGGICKNAEAGFETVRASAVLLGECFKDYHIIIYENNSTDATKILYSNWAKVDDHITFISEDFTKTEARIVNEMGVWYRTGVYARSRNRILDEVFSSRFSDYKYLLMVDLDFIDGWDIEAILETILHPEHDFDAVFSNGSYDLFALRSEEFPAGCELLGEIFLKNLQEERQRFLNMGYFNWCNPWIKVYSAFGGIALYKIDSIRGCRYSGVVTKNLETQVEKWLNKKFKELLGSFTVTELNDLARTNTWFGLDEQLGDYHLLKKYVSTLFEVDHFFTTENRFSERGLIDDEYIALRMDNLYSSGKINWLSCGKNETLPWTCEHVTFHADMIENGHDKLYFNPKWHSSHP